MEDKELCCICLDYTIDFDIIDFDIIDFGVEDFGIEDFSKGNSMGSNVGTFNTDVVRRQGNYKVLNCCNNTIHKYCLMILFLYGYEDCPLCRCNICINDYFTLDDFHDFYLYGNTSNTSEILNKLLWELCNSNYYYYFKTTFNTYVIRRQNNVCNTYNICNAYNVYNMYNKISSYLLCKVICSMIIIACFYFLLFYIFTLLYQS